MAAQAVVQAFRPAAGMQALRRAPRVVWAFRPAGWVTWFAIGVALMLTGSGVDASGAQSEPSRSIPIVRTERLGAGVIRIVYDLNGAPSTPVAVTLEASNDGGQTFAVRPRATRGDVGPNVTPGAGKVIEWDSTKDIDDLQLDRYVFRIVASPAAAPNATALKIVILEGEGVVNIWTSSPLALMRGQQIAVAPVIEVRDRNDLPVSGATVTFAIAGGRNATFANGAPTMTVMTNATGRAVAAGLNPVGTGAVQIAVQAVFQGQVAAAMIQQTNVAQTTSAMRSASAGAVGKTGGGLSRGVIAGIAGGAVAGGLGLAVAKGGGGTTSAATPPVSPTTSGANRIPVAGTIQISPQGQGLAFATQFSFQVVGSNDPDGDPLTFGWDFGDGGTTSAAVGQTSVTKLYSGAGTWIVRVTVDDGRGGSATTSTSVVTTDLNGTWSGRQMYAGDLLEEIATLRQSGSTVSGTWQERNALFPSLGRTCNLSGATFRVPNIVTLIISLPCSGPNLGAGLVNLAYDPGTTRLIAELAPGVLFLFLSRQ